jgi:hypothetical protein
MCGKVKLIKQNTLWIGWGKGTENFETRRKGKVGNFDSTNRGADTLNPEVGTVELDPLFCLQMRSVNCERNWCYVNGDLIRVMTGNWTRTVVFWNVRLKIWSSSSRHLKGRQMTSSSTILGLSDWWEWRHYVRIHSSKIAVSYAMWTESSAAPL